ncbi:sodium-dependent bicarbonate transport family permease [Rubellicoccus peritrichatus]|uniref:Sodium-dependent bicarbonate transport family permease n=1 Tax=Rubellicoccus peritrichatus TaxID=3080537 RepID=A0AAQ3L8V8_9BACT|nr:sodium-dependent bicarbonate transport family permease [Puniceicoccus sp. CR14]WOO40782.1 sodium-dependent bicarbonate transport family permease [Puniceicoccus sp. CR14]
MDSLLLLRANLLSPPVIAFAAGLVAVWVRSDLKFPEQVYQILTIYLLLAIGFKGGSAMADSSIGELAIPLLATIIVGALIPIIVFFAVRILIGMNVVNAAALAAHYGSVSAVTFMACLAFLNNQDISYENFMPALMAVMEIPAIFIAMLLAKIFNSDSKVSFGVAIHEVLSGKSFILLLCGLFAGAVATEDGRALMSPFLVTPFYGVLMLFLLEMGLVAGEKMKDARQAGIPLMAFAIISPILQGALGVLVSYAIGLSQGGAVIFAVLSASASYIAAPAAVRVSLPEANPGYYVTTSLAITFPFNLVIGIPLYFKMSEWIY